MSNGTEKRANPKPVVPLTNPEINTMDKMMIQVVSVMDTSLTVKIARVNLTINCFQSKLKYNQVLVKTFFVGRHAETLILPAVVNEYANYTHGESEEKERVTLKHICELDYIYSLSSNLCDMKRIKYLAPVLLSFYVMGFVDLVGVATGFVKEDFGLSDTLAQLLPGMVFLWFAVISIPTGLFQDRKGKKITVNLGMALTAVGVILPFLYYTYLTAIIGFMILGIGNTILQVSANPLLLDISAKGNKAANLSLSQFIKAIASMLGPVIVAALARYTGNWKLIFPIYAAVSLLAVLWISSVKVEEHKSEKPPATFPSVIRLLKRPFVVIMVLATFLSVGFDVGMNSNVSNYLSVRFAISLESASLGISIYFASLVVGRFLGSFLLRKMKTSLFLYLSLAITLAGLAGMLISANLTVVRVMIFIAGLGFSNIFPIIFALVIEHLPEYDNELSSLIILSIAGGAVIPPIMGMLSDNFGVTLSMSMLVICTLYILFASFYAVRHNKNH